MARTKRSATLDTRNKRLTLEPETWHMDTLSKHCYVGYRRPVSGACGVWQARWHEPATGKWKKKVLGSADDFRESNGIDVLSWSDAQSRATAWFDSCSQEAQTPATPVEPKPAYTVRMAVEAHILRVRRDGGDEATVRSYADNRIYPELAEVPLECLTKRRVEAWADQMAASPRLKTGAKGPGKAQPGEWKEQVEGKPETAKPTEDQIRARKVSANRVLAILKRACNLAVEDGEYEGQTGWRDVKPYKGVKKARLRFLNSEEQVRLVNACSAEFRPLCQAALLTGSRFAPLARMRVRDFNPVAETVWIDKDKGQYGGKARHIHLDEEAVEWFKGHVAGRRPDDLMFLRAPDVRRRTREGDGWLSSDQDGPLAEACKAAKLEPLTFHELRHTYASALVNAGVPLAYVAAQLGHANTRMVEEFYGHLAPSALAEAIKKLSPRRGLAGAEAQKVEALKVPKRKRA